MGLVKRFVGCEIVRVSVSFVCVFVVILLVMVGAMWLAERLNVSDGMRTVLAFVALFVGAGVNFLLFTGVGEGFKRFGSGRSRRRR